MLEHANIIWLLLSCIFAGSTTLHIRENRRLKKRLSSQRAPISSKWLLQFAWSRTIQFLTMIALCFLAIGTYAWQLQTTHEDLIEQVSKHPLPPIMTEEKSEKKETTSYYPPLISTNITPTAPTQTIGDLYDIRKNSMDPASTIDSLKVKYEEILVTYLFLKKCNKTNPADYALITSTLLHEMSTARASARLQYDILTAAQGSYKEVYAKNNCDHATVDTLNAQYTNYINSLTKIADLHAKP